MLGIEKVLNMTTIWEALYTLFFLLAVLSRFPGIISALLEDSKQVSFQRGFARYFLAILSTCATNPNFYDLRLFCVPAQRVKT